MKKVAAALTLGLLAGLPFANDTNSRASDDAVGASKSYILLQNGIVWCGQTKKIGERIEIRLDEGSVIQIDEKQILTIAGSKEDLYRYQINSIRVWGSGEHWHLTQWCIKQDMLEQAIYHYQELSKLAAPDKRFKQLEMDLRAKLVATLSSSQQKPTNASTVQSGASNMVSSAALATNKSDSSGGEVQLASATAPASSTREVPSSQQRLEEKRAILAIPGYVKKSFQMNISPILVYRCGQAGCHGIPGKSDFHIMQAVGSDAPEIQSQNLQQVLRYINTKNPTESELLLYATNAHGIQKNAGLNPHREDERVHIERITQWIKSIEFSSSIDSASGSEQPNHRDRAVVKAVANEVTSEDFADLSRKEKIERWQKNVPEADRDAKLSKPTKTSSGPAALTAGEISELETAIEKLEKTHKNKSKDPFDPDLFNSQFGSKKP